MAVFNPIIRVSIGLGLFWYLTWTWAGSTQIVNTDFGPVDFVSGISHLAIVLVFSVRRILVAIVLGKIIFFGAEYLLQSCGLHLFSELPYSESESYFGIEFSDL